MQENYPFLVSCKTLKPEYNNVKKIAITCENFTIGRGLQNDVVIPFLSISRNHCVFTKSNEDVWTIQDFSSFGIEINGNRLGKGTTRQLSHEDIIALEPSKEFMYKFIDSNFEDVIPRKRIKLEESVNSDIIKEESVNSDIINDVKIKFEESQSFEMRHIEEKIQNAKQMQTTSLILKQQLQSDMNRKVQQLESDFALQIENLKGEKNEVERQKAVLMEERDALLATVKEEMEGKIAGLMDQIHKLNDTESELLKENNSLKGKLLKEREEFLSELSRESSSKQDMLDKLQAKIKEQEEIRLKEKQELEDMLRKETEQLRLAKEKELMELEKEKQQRELELIEELNSIKRKLEEHVEQTDQEKVKAEQQLNEQMKKLSDEEKVKMEQLAKEKEDMQKQLSEAETNAEKSKEMLRAQLHEREIELAALAAERIQKQADQSSEVICALQEQLEKVRSQLQVVESEKNILLETHQPTSTGEGTSKQVTIEEVGEVMDSELQCSICGELFVAATTLNCSHTFCKYCISMWKKKKKDCPICRASITSECKSLVLDSFIDKMVHTLSEDTKTKRQELLRSREAEVAAMMTPRSTPRTATARRGRRNTTRGTTTSATRSTTTTGPRGSAGPAGGGTASRTPTVDLTGIPIVGMSHPVTPRIPALPPPGQRIPVPLPPPGQRIRVPLPPPGQRIAVSLPPHYGAPPGPMQVEFRQAGPVTVPYRLIQHNGQTVVVVATGVGGGAGAFQVRLAHTTAATGAATTATGAATGRPAAPSDNPPQ